MPRTRRVYSSDSRFMFFQSEHEADEAVRYLAALGARARKLLEECVTETVIIRTKLSAAAHALEGAGFIHIRDVGNVFTSEYEIKASLWGEDALAMLEQQEGQGNPCCPP